MKNKILYFVTMECQTKESISLYTFELEFEKITKSNLEEFKTSCREYLIENIQGYIKSFLVSWSIINED